jgi:hypothetical protein
LGLRCDYKRPVWWSNSDQRKQQKEIIKNIIKRTQMAKKNTPSQPAPLPSSTPPGLTHSAPTSAEVPHAKLFPQNRRPSHDSPYLEGDFKYNPELGQYAMPPPPQAYIPSQMHGHYPTLSPYEVDIKTERQIYVNDIPTRKDSTISTFSTYQSPQLTNGMQSLSSDGWIQQEHFESLTEQFTEEPVDFNFFEYPHDPQGPDHETIININDNDKYLLSHFIDKNMKLIFPILDANQHGSARSDVILPALESNQAYLHCCLSVAAEHMRATENVDGEQINNDILNHRFGAIQELCAALGADTNHAQTLEATLAMIFFPTTVGGPSDAVADIPWYSHFSAAVNLVNKLELPSAAIVAAQTDQRPPFNMTLTAWIDILGATIEGSAPTFSDTYRELHRSRSAIGLAELMGCDDQIMFIISEIACLDSQKQEGLDPVSVCHYVKILARGLDDNQPAPATVVSCFSTTGAIRPRQLAINLTAVFCLAARIYMCTLVIGYSPGQDSMRGLIEQFTECLNFIPAGPEGFDRSLAWPLLIAGAESLPDSTFRLMLADRCGLLGDAANSGSLGRVRELLTDVWTTRDQLVELSDAIPDVRWRDIMRQKNWGYLLI